MSLYDKRVRPILKDLREIEEDTVESRQTFDFKKAVADFITTQTYFVFMALITIYSIFAIDIEKVCLPADYSQYFGIAHILAITIFTIDIAMNFGAKADYKWSFTFWVDVFSTLTMILEIYWIDNFLSVNANVPGVLTFGKLIKASRLTKIGARAAKIITLFGEMLEIRREQKEKQKIALQLRESFPNEQSVKQEKEDQIEDNTMKEMNAEGDRGKKVSHLKSQCTELQVVMNQNVSFGDKPVSERKDTKKALRRIAKRNTKMGSVKVQDDLNAVERWQRFIQLPPIYRANVDPFEQQVIQERYMQICRREIQLKDQKEKINLFQENFKLGEALKLNIQKITIIMIMGLVVFLPMLDSSTWLNQNPTIDIMVDPIIRQALATDPVTGKKLLDAFTQACLNMSTPLVYLHVNLNGTCCTFPSKDFPNLIATEELSNVASALQVIVSSTNYMLIFSSHKESQMTSELNIARSLGVALLLVFSSIIFMNSIEKYALHPLQKMCISINNLSINPFESLKSASTELESKPMGLETEILERAIIKMTSLLALGAGELGAQMITTKADDSIITNCDKLHGIFMYVKIKPLKQDAKYIPQLNIISRIISETCIMYGGVPIENEGTAHLLFWKNREENILDESKSFSFPILPKKPDQIYALVLYALLEMNVKLRGEQFWQDSMRDEDEDEEVDDYFLKAGLHAGSCLEGSIGSNYKLQAKFLGEDVRFAKKLCHSCQYYGVGAVLSQEFCLIVGESEYYQLRKIDYVKDRQLKTPFHLYCFDFTNPKSQKFRRRKEYCEKQIYQKRELVLAQLQTEDIESILPKTKTHGTMTADFSDDFYQNWSEAIEQYYDERWEDALGLFESLNEQNSKDGPTNIFLARMKQTHGEVPKNWVKYREISFSLNE